MRLKQYISFFLGWPLSLIALYYLSTLFTSQWHRLASKSISVDWTLVGLSFFLCTLYYLFRVLCWEQLLPQTQEKDHFKRTALYWMLAELQRFVPGNIWGQIARIKYFTHRVPEKKHMVKLLTQESYIVTIGSAVVGFIAFPRVIHMLPVLQWSVLGGLLLCALSTIFFIQKLPIASRIFRNVFLADRMRILLPMSLAFFALGLGAYCAIKAVAPLSLNDWASVTGLFSIALLAGYVAIIAPMGLGVREAALVFFLQFFMPLGTATLAAIAARIIALVAEAGVIVFLLLWQRIQTNVVESWIGKHRYELGLAVMTCLYILYFTCATFAKQDTFFTGRFDLGNMDQVVWNSMQGHWFQFTDPNGTGIISRLAFHGDVLLVDLAPLYWLWDDPKMLLLAQTVALGSGGVLVYLIAVSVLRKKSIALVLSLSYFLYPAVAYVNLYDFHMVSFATPLLLGAWYAYLRKHIYLTMILLVFAGLSKETVWIAVCVFGLFLLWKRYWWQGVLLVGSSIGLFFLFISYVIPATRGTTHFAIAYYGDFGDSLHSVLLGIITKPNTLFTTVFQLNKLGYLLLLGMPVGFLALLGWPYLLFAGGDFTINLLSNNPNMTQLYYQYTSVITPFVFIATIYGVERVLRWKYTHLSWLLCYLIMMACIGAFTVGPLPGSTQNNVEMFEHQLSYRTDVQRALTLIPANASVAATNNLGAHLSHRNYIFTIPTGIDTAEYLAFLLTDNSAQPSLQAQRGMVYTLQHNPSYETLFSEKDFYLFKKK